MGQQRFVASQPSQQSRLQSHSSGRGSLVPAPPSLRQQEKMETSLSRAGREFFNHPSTAPNTNPGCSKKKHVLAAYGSGNSRNMRSSYNFLSGVSASTKSVTTKVKRGRSGKLSGRGGKSRGKGI